MFGAEIDRDENRSPQLSSEHTEFAWCTEDEALELLSWENYRLGLKAVMRVMSDPDLLRITQILI